MAIYREVSPASLLSVYAGNNQRALVDKPGMIRAQMTTHTRSEMATIRGTPCVIPPLLVVTAILSPSLRPNLNIHQLSQSHETIHGVYNILYDLIYTSHQWK
jgi:hypothetical protein